MRAPRGSYGRYGVGCALAWLVALAVAARVPDEGKRRAVRITCAGWWLGWLSATIARQVYPPPGR
jgi:hypothetical protein